MTPDHRLFNRLSLCLEHDDDAKKALDALAAGTADPAEVDEVVGRAQGAWAQFATIVAQRHAESTRRAVTRLTKAAS